LTITDKSLKDVVLALVIDLGIYIPVESDWEAASKLAIVHSDHHTLNAINDKTIKFERWRCIDH
jgi:hypothetical protein